jgi:hypothetical protein
LRTEYNPFVKNSFRGPRSGLAQVDNLALEGSDNVPLHIRRLNNRIREVAARHKEKVVEIFSSLAANPNALLCRMTVFIRMTPLTRGFMPRLWLPSFLV